MPQICVQNIDSIPLVEGMSSTFSSLTGLLLFFRRPNGLPRFKRTVARDSTRQKFSQKIYKNKNRFSGGMKNEKPVVNLLLPGVLGHLLLC